MNLDYSNYRLNSISELEPFRQRLGNDIFWNFIISVFEWLDSMEVGDSIDISNNSRITNQNRELFIKTTCYYMQQYGNDDYMFTNDYTSLYRFDREAEINDVRKFFDELEKKRIKLNPLCTTTQENE